MSYLTPRAHEPAAADVLLTLAGIAGFKVPPEDLPQLARALADQLASMQVLDTADLSDHDAVTQFDPRWHAAS